MTRATIVIGLIVLPVALTAAVRFQTQPAAGRPAFDVASVKANPAKGAPSMIVTPTSLLYTSVSLSDCLQAAYGMKHHQISGPDWLASDRYNISARIGSPTTADRIRAMLGTLLADRFALAFHVEKRALPLFVIVPDKNGPKLGRKDPNGERRVELLAGRMAISNTTLGELADFLSSIPSLGRPVIDGTGLEGRFDVTIRIDPGPGDPSPERTKMALVEGGPSIVTDSLDEAGLKLEGRRDPIDVLVIDHAERVPTPD